MITIISISLAILVIVAGLLLLAKTKKEDLGGLFTFSSYAVITCGILLTAYAFVGCIVNCCSNKGACGKSSYSQCHGSGQGGSCASYGRGCCKSEKSGYHQGKNGHYSKSGCSKSSCSYSSKACSKSSKCCSKKKSGKRKEIRKIIKIDDDGNEDVDVTVKIIE